MNQKGRNEKKQRSGRGDEHLSRFFMEERDRRLLRKLYTNKGKSEFLCYPVIANGKYALAHIKNGECGVLLIKDLLAQFEHPESLPHLKI